MSPTISWLFTIAGIGFVVVGTVLALRSEGGRRRQVLALIPLGVGLEFTAGALVHPDPAVSPSMVTTSAGYALIVVAWLIFRKGARAGG